MLKKYLIFIFLILSLISCTNIELKHLSPIPTRGNDGGLLQLFQDMLTGNWVRFKEKNKTVDEKEVDDFFNRPLLTETGEEIPVDNFKTKSTKEYKIEWAGVAATSKEISFKFSFIIKDPNIKLEYVKIQSVVPNNVLTFIDETVENFHSNPNVKVITKVKVSSDDGTKSWTGLVSNIPNVFFYPNEINKYLVKFTIKAVGKKEVIIYQPVFLPVIIVADNSI